MKTEEKIRPFMSRFYATREEWERIKSRCESRKQNVGRFLVESGIKELDREKEANGE